MMGKPIRWRNVDSKLRSRMKVAKVINGCGPKGAWWSRFVPNKILRLDVEEFCDWHDLNYIVGGKEADRLKADWQFYEAIHGRAIELTSGWTRPFRFVYTSVAWLYYRSVRSGGAPHFNYEAVLDHEAVILKLVAAEREMGLAA